ncbi:MAG: hypothetical protein ACRDV7_09015, partial [Acidimicrobiia bacterium]
SVLLAGCLSACAPSPNDRPAPARADIREAEVTRGFHVAPHGRDGSAGTIDRPWRTLTAALSRLHAGDTLWVHDGVYQERIDITASAGRPDARITVAPFPGDRPLLRGMLWLGEPSYWTIEGLRVTSDEQHSPDKAMVRLYGGTGWVLRNSELFGARSVAALMIDDGPRQNLGEFAVRENCIHDTAPSNGQNQDHNIYVDDFGASPAPHGVIERNVIFNAPNGNNVKLGGGNGGGPRNVEVRFNSMLGANRNVSLSIGATGNQVSRNLLMWAREANVFAFDLTGLGNAVYDNLTFASASPVGRSDTSAPVWFDRNLVRDPKIDAVSCTGLRPTGSELRYGRYATR